MEDQRCVFSIQLDSSHLIDCGDLRRQPVTILRNFDVSRQLYLMMSSSEGVVVILALVVMIWQSRKRVTQAILAEDVEPGTPGKGSAASGWIC